MFKYITKFIYLKKIKTVYNLGRIECHAWMRAVWSLIVVWQCHAWLLALYLTYISLPSMGMEWDKDILESHVKTDELCFMWAVLHCYFFVLVSGSETDSVLMFPMSFLKQSLIRRLASSEAMEHTKIIEHLKGWNSWGWSWDNWVFKQRSTIATFSRNTPRSNILQVPEIENDFRHRSPHWWNIWGRVTCAWRA